MKIITVPNPTLTKKSTPITKIDKKLVKFIQNLEKTLKNKKNPEGVGLSAPQVNRNLNLFCTYVDMGGVRKIRTYLNPRITKSSSQLTLGRNPNKPFLEGCLSIPNIYGPVWRHQWVKLEYQRLNQETLTLEDFSERFESFPARVIQHEYDHLEGVLFTQRAVESKLPLYQEDPTGQLVEITA